MSKSIPIPEIDRITFFDGERLSADDLNAVDQATRDLRWLHNQTLHGWGIATGLGVTGKTGDRSVTIAQGMAVDSSGREIMLSAAQTMPLPMLSGSTAETMYYVTASYQGDSKQKVLEQRAGVCAQGGAARLANDPLLQWQSAPAVSEGKQIILGTVWIRNCKLSRDVSGSSRRLLSPPSTFPVASGRTDPATTEWSPWTMGQLTVGFTTVVNTSAAKFGGVPKYVAQLVGEIYLASSPGPLLAVAQTSIADVSATKFTLRAMLLEGTAGVPVNPAIVRTDGPAIFKQLGWSVAWMGVEG